MNFLTPPTPAIHENSPMDEAQMAVAVEFVEELKSLGVLAPPPEGVEVKTNSPLGIGTKVTLTGTIGSDDVQWMVLLQPVQEATALGVLQSLVGIDVVIGGQGGYIHHRIPLKAKSGALRPRKLVPSLLVVSRLHISR